ncbi:coleoptile phototropism protein 1-like [Oryza brachyantha]|uniref:coleoptile phototropism protein 1-like n=1 Tax=Oryza brachyantha TaxID=4533 RepID=UPI001AD9A0CC|nr:coleoptile phototropism protein 1-like [Oryza brachyantha]
MTPPSPPHGSPDARLVPPSPVAAAAGAGAAVTPPRRSCDDAAACVVNDVDAFARTIASIRSKPAAAASSSSDGGGDHLATVLSHYAARWLPDVASSPSGRFLLPPQSPTATWIRKRLLLESLVAALPPEGGGGGGGDDDDGGVTCDFLLRLLRAGSMAGADAALLADLEARAARRLDQASLGAVMIPAFRCGGGGGDPPGASATLLDVPLVLRLVRGFLREGGKAGGGAAAACRVARLVDAYLAEAALEAGLRPAEFEELARAVPAHARAADDGLYRAVDTYLKAHPHAGKEERRSLCRLIDARKLSAEAAAHAVQNERLPVRCVVQVLFSEHGSKLTRLAEWTTGSFRSLQARSPADVVLAASAGGGGGGARCPSKREVVVQHHELRRLREDVSRLQVQCHALQAQVDRLSSDHRRRRGLFKWGALLFGGGAGAGATGAAAVVVDDSDSGLDRTPLSGKKGVRAGAGSTPATGTPAVARWRRSHS